MSALNRIMLHHAALWNSDAWYRFAWYTWPQIVSLIIVGWIFSDTLHKSAPWAVPMPQEQSTPNPANFPNAQLCSDALNRPLTDWDPDPSYRGEIEEAKRRGFSVFDCRKILGLDSPSKPSNPVPHQPSPSPGPPIDPRGNVAQQLRELTTGFLDRWYTIVSGPNSDALAAAAATYADQVDYYGKSQSRDQVLAEWQSFMNRWPNRQYKVRQNTLEIDCGDLTWSCNVKGFLDFDDNSPARNARTWGSATFEYVLQFKVSSATPQIVREAGTPVERHPEPLSPTTNQSTPQSGTCDELAANPNDPAKSPDVAGVPYALLGAQSANAIASCDSAAQNYPNQLRFQYQLARALETTGDQNDRQKAFAIYKRLVDLRYAAAFDNLGWLYLTLNPSTAAFGPVVDLFRTGVSLGDSDAMVSLAEMIIRGRAAPLNPNETPLALITRAMQLSNKAAYDELAKINTQRCSVMDPTGTPLNVRTNPNGTIITTLNNGTSVMVLNSINSNGRVWAYVTTGNKDGATGWAFQNYLNCVPRPG
jgi:hypothetical protein